MPFSESNKVELKEKMSGTLAKEIVSFLNSESGTIYIGVRKDGVVAGVPPEDIDETMRQVSDVITDQISPSCITLVHQHLEKIEEKNVIQIDVYPGEKLYYIKKYGLSEAGCFVRNGSTCKSLPQDEIMRRFVSTLEVPEKDITEMPAHRKDLSFGILKNYLLTNGIHYYEDTFLDNFHLLTSKGEYNYMAEILADKNDISINVATFATTDKTQYLRREEFGGKCLLLAMEKAKNYVESINKTYVEVGILPRKEQKMFDQEAFEQAWINACVHNKWSVSDHPGIYIYSDRLEIESYGGIPRTLTKEEFLKGKSDPVNKRLFDIFAKCRFAEESGHGVPSVVRAYGRNAYVFSTNFIDVVIPFAHFEQENQEILVKTPKKYHEKTREEILDLLEKYPYFSQKDVMDSLGLTEGMVKNHFNRLKKEGRIFHEGPDKGGYWRVNATLKK